MLVYLCRHAQAAPGTPDEERPLTDAGVAQARMLGAHLAAAAPRPSAVLSSPLLRARQTAAEVAAALSLTPEVDDRLSPGATVADLSALAAEREGPFVTVGHQPDCSEIVLTLTGADPGFPVASMQRVELAGNP
ncbi:MAG: histidine phosphatase family protein [Gaiellales bacterium]